MAGPESATEKSLWFPITAGNEAVYDTFRIISREGTRALYQINAADKAKAVPFIKIWQVSRNSNGAVSGTILSSEFTRPPQFGTSVGSFPERPDVSIDSVQVKNHMPMGWILWRDIDINIMIHRPDVLNNVSKESRALGALLRPGNTFVLRYGWVGGDNGALGPGGSQRELRPEFTPHEEKVFESWELQQARAAIGVASPPDRKPEWFKTIFTARTDVRFTVTHYNFTIQPDNQVKLTVHAKEDGTLDVSQALLTDQDEIEGILDPAQIRQAWEKDPKTIHSDTIHKIVDFFNERIDAGSFPKMIEFPDPNDPSKTVKQNQWFIETQLLYNILFAQPITKALRNLGYKHVHLYFGVFQDNLCATLPSYDSANGNGIGYGGYSIGHFQMRRDDARKILNEVISTGGEITVNNLMDRFRAYLQGPDNNIWDMKTTPHATTSIPEIQKFMLLNPEAGYARVQVVDRKRYLNLLGGVPDVNDQNYHKKKAAIAGNLQSILSRNFIPYLSLFHQGSFFQDAKFEIVQDERMRSIFIANRNRLNRTNVIAGQDPVAQMADEGASGPLILYRSAVKGTITMIGNFVFSYAGYVWIHFGVPDLDGLFYVMQKTDNIGKEGFTSTYGFQAEGSNPLGSPAQKGGSLQDVVRSKVQEALGAPNFDPKPTAAAVQSREQAEKDAGFFEGTLKTPVEGKTESDVTDFSNYPTK